MNLHFDEPVDKTRQNSAVFEFFSDDIKPVRPSKKLKGKPLSKLIAQRRFVNYYRKKRAIRLQLKLMQILVVLAVIVCFALIVFLLSNII